MLKIIFYLKSNKVNNQGESAIFARVTYEHDSFSLSTGKNISKERWDATNKLRNVLKIDREKTVKKNLELFQIKIDKKFNELYKTNPDVTAVDLKKHLNGKVVKSKVIGIIDLFNKHNADFLKRVDAGERSSASFQKYNRSRDLIQAFIRKEYGEDNMDVNSITGSFIYSLESYLKYDSKYKEKVGIKNNSVVKYFKNFKTVCNYGLKLELINKNPFNSYDGKLNIKEAIFLTQDELNKIEDKKFDIERLEKVKDIFLFSCYTGYAPIDACNLTSANLIKDNYGDVWIKTNRTKTGIKANVPLLSPIQRIIDKYDGQQLGLIPKISNQKINSYLKEIADLCGIAKNLTWYVARHTFATTVTLGNGIKLENVSSMMGHSNIKQTQHYAKVLDFNIMDDMSKLKSIYK